MFRNDVDRFKLISGYALGGAAGIFCLVAAVLGSSRAFIDILVCIAGGTIGWSLGLYLTPSSEGEKKLLSDGTKTIVAFIGGIGIGKADKLFPQIAELLGTTAQETPLRAMLFFCMLMLGGLYTYIGRLFLLGPDADLRSARAKAIKDLRTATDKLEAHN